jgi:hypothetical protein
MIRSFAVDSLSKQFISRLQDSALERVYAALLRLELRNRYPQVFQRSIIDILQHLHLYFDFTPVYSNIATGYEFLEPSTLAGLCLHRKGGATSTGPRHIGVLKDET